MRTPSALICYILNSCQRLFHKRYRLFLSYLPEQPQSSCSNHIDCSEGANRAVDSGTVLNR